MITQKITCDHCGTEVPNVYDKRFSFMAINAAAQMGTIDACSKEHLGIALAKMFGIGINGDANELLDRKQRELTKLIDANNVLIIDRDNMRARVAEHEARTHTFDTLKVELQRVQARERALEKRLAEMPTPLTVDGKTPGQVGLAAWDDELASLETKPASNAPICFLCGKGPHDHTMATLESLPEQFEVTWCNGRRQNFGNEKPIWWDKPTSDHVHEIGSCSFCDKLPPGTASITDPSKPTKPEES